MGVGGDEVEASELFALGDGGYGLGFLLAERDMVKDTARTRAMARGLFGNY